MFDRAEKSGETIITGQRPGEKLTLARQMRRLPTPAEAKLWCHLWAACTIACRLREPAYS